MTAKPDPCRLALAQADGLLRAAGRLLARCPDTEGMREALRAIVRQTGAQLDALPLQEPFKLVELAPVSASRAEVEWRVQEVEAAHTKAYRAFKRENGGIRLNGSGPLPDSVRKLIRDALREYDGHLLGADQREEWLRDSRVRAAGIGIFYDDWSTGIFREAQTGERPRDWHGPYLEHDRPWRRRAGKPDPILRFAEKYFEARALAEAADV